MNKLNKVQLRSARTKILHEISVLDTQRCEHCTPDDDERWNKSTSNCECVAAVKIRELGEDLMKLVSERIEVKKKVPTFDFGENTIKTLTVKLYREAKAQGLTDPMISESLGVNKSTVDRWKIHNGISKRRRRKV